MIETEREYVLELCEKIKYLLKFMNDNGLTLEDGSFTFPDGDTWTI